MKVIDSLKSVHGGEWYELLDGFFVDKKSKTFVVRRRRGWKAKTIFPPQKIFTFYEIVKSGKVVYTIRSQSLFRVDHCPPVDFVEAVRRCKSCGLRHRITKSGRTYCVATVPVNTICYVCGELSIDTAHLCIKEK